MWQKNIAQLSSLNMLKTTPLANIFNAMKEPAKKQHKSKWGAFFADASRRLWRLENWLAGTGIIF